MNMVRTLLNQSLFKSAIPIIGLGFLFLVSAYLAQTQEDFFMQLIGESEPWGLLIYIGIATFTTVLAPLSSIPLMPLASGIWGAPLTALASIAGWMMGALISFYLSKKYGRAFVEKIVSPEKLSQLEKRIPEKNLFWSILLLRMLVPVDLLSYVLGLFKAVSWKVYFWATFLGIIPFAFVFAYLGTLPWKFQLLGFILVLPILFFINKNKQKAP